MIPDFALSLSFSGISLLQRAAMAGGPSQGWYLLGEVPLDVSDLGGALAMLRQEALDHPDMDGPEVKLVLPNEQIKYLSLTLEGDDPLAQAEAALEGATPYAREDIVFDWRASDGQLQIAAVAKETLKEAEVFASENRFLPLTFVAIPGPGEFDGEPFFGPTETALTQLAPGVTVTGDSDAIALIDKVVDANDPHAIQTVVATVEEAGATPIDPPDVGEAEESMPEPVFHRGRRFDPEPSQQEPKVDLAAPTLPSPGDLPESPIPVVAPAVAAEAPPVAFASLRANREEEGSVAEAPSAPNPAAEGISPKLGAPLQNDVAREEHDPLAQDVEIATPQVDEGQFKSVSRGVDAEVPEQTPPLSAPKRDISNVTNVLARAQSGLGRSIAFVSRRDGSAPTPSPVAVQANAPQGAAAAALTAGNKMDEAERMTMFGARRQVSQARIGGKPRFLGLILTSALLLFLLGVAAWAAIFVDEGLARFMPQQEHQDIPRDTALSVPQVPSESEVLPQETPPAPNDTSLEFGLTTSEPDLADDPNGLTTGLPAEIAPDVAVEAETGLTRAIGGSPLTEEEADQRYSASGIWQRAPSAPSETRQDPLDDLYITSIDRSVVQQDAIALPNADGFGDDTALAAQALPPKADQRFQFDERGLIRPTPEGVETPDGYRVVLGTPDITPPARRPLVRFEPAADPEETGTGAPVVSDPSLNGLRPRLRPDNIQERTERAQLGGLSRAEFAALRPRSRPSGLVEQRAAQEAANRAVAAALAAQQEAEANAESPEAEAPAASQLAVTSAILPQARPRNLKPPKEPAPREVAAVKPRTVTPSIPSRASVTRAATQTNAINLRRINLIGVYGKPSNRQALVRLSNGRFKRVQVGDRIDGGRVLAISDSQLRYQKSGRNVTLEIPQG